MNKNRTKLLFKEQFSFNYVFSFLFFWLGCLFVFLAYLFGSELSVIYLGTWLIYIVDIAIMALLFGAFKSFELSILYYPLLSKLALIATDNTKDYNRDKKELNELESERRN